MLLKICKFATKKSKQININLKMVVNKVTGILFHIKINLPLYKNKIDWRLLYPNGECYIWTQNR